MTFSNYVTIATKKGEVLSLYGPTHRPRAKPASMESQEEHEEVVEVEEGVEILPEEVPEESEESMELEQRLEVLASSLGLSEDALQCVASSEEGRLLLEKVEERLKQKETEIEEYEATLNDLTQNMSQQTREFEKCMAGVH